MLKEFIEAVPDAMLAVDASGTIHHANGAALEMFGWPREDLVGASLDLLVPPHRRADHANLVRAFLASPRRREMGQGREFTTLRRDGTTFVAEIALALAPFRDGDAALALASVRDLTARRREAAESQAREERHREIMLLARAGTWEFDFASQRRVYSPEMLSMLGLDRSHENTANLLESVHPDDRALITNATARVGAEGRPYAHVVRFRNPSGGWRHLEARGFPILDGAGVVTGVRGLAMDVTQLHDAEERLRVTLHTIPDLICITDDASCIEFLNRASTGRRGDEATGLCVEDHLGPDAKAARRAALDEAISTREFASYASRVRTGDGVERFYEHRVRVLSQEDSPRRFLEIATETTERRAAMAEVESYRHALEQSIEGYARIGADGGILSVNHAYASILGWDPAELATVPWVDTFCPGTRAPYEAALKRFLDEEHVTIELCRVHRSGVQVPVQMTLVRACGTDGENLGHHCFIRDLTEQRRASERLLISDRMASIGMLAAGVAHELNNPLAAMLLNLDVALSCDGTVSEPPSAADREELRTLLRETRASGGRLQQIVGELRLFARGGEERVGAVDLHAVIDTTLRLASNEVRHRARVVTELGEVPPVRADEGRLGQVLLNLVVNAAQSIGEGNAEHQEIRVRTRLDPSGLVRIEVHDTGHGIAPENLRRLFTPFFTTKAPGQGTGLGLSICHRIVTGFGGSIEVASQSGRGTVFTVLLHAAEVVAPIASVERPPPEAITRRCRLLIVDDEPALLNALRRALSFHYEVRVAACGAEALALLDGGERFDLILCDIMMPQMTGIQLREQVQRRDPELARRMVFATGGAFTDTARAFIDDGSIRHVEKPFDLGALRTALADVLHAAERAEPNPGSNLDVQGQR